MKTPFWEQRQLGDVAQIVGGGTPDTSNPDYWNGDINWFSPNEIGQSVYASESRRKISQSGLEHSSATLLPAGRTILFTSRAGIGDTAILLTTATTNQGFQSWVLDDHMDIYFMYCRSLTAKTWAERMAGGSTFLEVSAKTMEKMPIAIPSITEQKNIGTFFRILDSLIAAAERKCDLLKLKKQAYLQQMFPQNGEEQPRLRFKGFTGDWEQRQLGELAEVGTGSHNTQDGKQAGLYPFFIRSEQKLFMDSFDFDEEAILVPGDGRIGEVFHYQNGPYALHQRVYRLHDFHGISTHFLLYLLESGFRAHALKVNSQGTVPSLRHASFTDWLVQIPSPQEQEAIALLLAQLDSLISAAEHKLETLKQLKQGYLQQMFV